MGSFLGNGVGALPAMHHWETAITILHISYCPYFKGC